MIAPAYTDPIVAVQEVEMEVVEEDINIDEEGN